jgi:ABC-type Fe3+-hydroxamate transport system substrate-binding protein
LPYQTNNKMKKDQFIYAVSIKTAGSDEEEIEDFVFATTKKEKAEKWVKKFNRIVDENKERIQNIDWCDETPLWYDFLKWDQPTAEMKEIPRR